MQVSVSTSQQIAVQCNDTSFWQQTGTGNIHASYINNPYSCNMGRFQCRPLGRQQCSAIIWLESLRNLLAADRQGTGRGNIHASFIKSPYSGNVFLQCVQVSVSSSQQIAVQRNDLTGIFTRPSGSRQEGEIFMLHDRKFDVAVTPDEPGMH